MAVSIEDLVSNSPYSASKAGADMIVKSFSETYGLNMVIAMLK